MADQKAPAYLEEVYDKSVKVTNKSNKNEHNQTAGYAPMGDAPTLSKKECDEMAKALDYTNCKAMLDDVREKTDMEKYRVEGVN